MQSKAAVNRTLRAPLGLLRFNPIFNRQDAEACLSPSLHAEPLTTLSRIIYYFREIFNAPQKGDDARVRWYDTETRNIPVPSS